MKTINFDKLPHEHQTMVHLPYDKVMTVLDRLYKATVLDCFCVTLRPPFTLCQVEGNGISKIPTRLTITFDSRGDHTNLSGLLALLSEYTTELIWKSDNRGYTVDAHGFILQSWELDDGMC